MQAMTASMVGLKQAAESGSFAISHYNREGVEGGAGTAGIVPAINQLKSALEEARLALQKAIENYREVAQRLGILVETDNALTTGPRLVQ